MQRFAIFSGLLVIGLALTSSTVMGQHFEPPEEGSSHSLIIQSATIDGEELVENDEIGVFTPGGICAGAVIVEEALGMAAYGDDPGTEEVEGFLGSEVFTFMLWDASAGQELEAMIQFGSGPETWEINGVTVITRLFWYEETIPLINLSDDEHDFGEIGVDQTISWILTISSIGSDDLTVSEVTLNNQAFDTDFDGEDIVLEPGQSHDLLVSFTPPDLDDQNGTLTITSNDFENEEVTVALSGTGTEDITPDITLSSYEIDFEEWPIDWSRHRVLTISNDGPGALTISDFDIDPDVFTSDWDEEDVEINPGASFDLTVTFTPEEAEVYEGELTITSDDLDEEIVIVDLLGTGTEFEDHFHHIRSGEGHMQLIVEASINGEPLVTGDEIGVFNDDGVCSGHDVVVGIMDGREEARMGFSAWLAMDDIPGFDMGETLRFRIWDLSAELEVEATVNRYLQGGPLFQGQDGFNAIDSLYANTADEPDIYVTPALVDFGQVGTGYSAAQFVRIRNVGADVLRVTNIEATEPFFEVDFQVGFIVRPGRSRYVRVTFTPEEIQTYDAILEITSDSPDEELVEVELTGEGIEPPAMIEVSETSHNYGIVPVGTDAMWELIIANTGGEDLTIDSLISDNDMFSTDFPDEAVVLSPDEDITVEVTFNPEEDIFYSGTLTIYNDDPDEDDQEIDIDLAGRGEYMPAIRVRPQSVDFVDVEINTVESTDITIINDGAANLVISDISVTGQYFSVDFDGGFEVEPEGEEVFQVHYAPTEIGDHNGIITIESNDPDTPKLIPVAGNAVETPEPPFVENPIDDVQLEEDFDPYYVADLDEVFTDPNDDELTYYAQSSDDNLIPEVRDDHLLYLDSVEDWFGTATVTVTADDDPNGGERDRGPVRGLRSISGRGFSPRRDLTAQDEFEVEVTALNDEPEWINVPDDIAQDEETLVEFTLVGEDVDDEELTITYDPGEDPALPAAEEVFTDNGYGTAVFSWQTDFEDAGDYTATFTISDAQYDIPVEVNISIGDVNRAPVWDFLPPEIELNETDVLEATIVGHDLDGDEVEITYVSDDLPQDRITFNDNGDGTAYILWETNYDDAGVYHAIITISDYQYDTDQEVTITIYNVNRTPEWVEVPEPISVQEGETIQFTVTGTDPDDDELTITYDPGADPALPDNAFTDNGGGRGDFYWETQDGDDGEYLATFTLSDDDFEVDAEVIIAVGDVNRPPYWYDIPDQVEGNENATIEFTVRGADPDDDPVTLSLSESEDIPAEAFVDNEDGTGTFSWETGFYDAGEYIATFTVSDETYDTDHDVTIIVSNVNRMPVWIDIPEEAIVVDEGVEIQFTVEGDDPDEDDEFAITYNSDNLPEAVELEDHGDGTATFTWQTWYLDAGNYSVTFNLNDGTDEVVSDEVVINVNDRNAPPQWINVPEEINVNEGALINVTIVAEDVDGDQITLAYRSDDLPDNVLFTDHENGTGTFVWQTNYQDAGNYLAIFTASDDEFDVEIEVPVNVTNVNQPPVWDYAPNQVTIDEGQDWQLIVRGSDVDGDELSIEFASDDLPEEATFEYHGDGTGTLAWQPEYNDEGNYEAAFIITDGNFDVSTIVAIEVTNVNRAPVWVDYPVDPIVVHEDDLVEFGLSGYDPDEDNLTITYSTHDLPEAVEFDDHGDGTGSFLWQTTAGDEGDYTATFTMSDGDLRAEIDVEISVSHINHSPFWVDVPFYVDGDPGARLYIDIAGDDPDEGDELNISWSRVGYIPPGAIRRFSDNGDGTATLQFETDEAGTYIIEFHLSDAEFTVDEDIYIIIGDQNIPPHWVTDFPLNYRVNENTLIGFSVAGEDPNEDDDLTITMTSDNLPEGAEFTYNGDGTGDFLWQTTCDDAGYYVVTFTLSDGEYERFGEVTITVNNMNRTPVWEVLPGSWAGDENTLMQFSVRGSDPDCEDLTITFESEDLPDEAEFTDNGDGTGAFSWQTDYDDAGRYTASFTLSDGVIEVTRETSIRVNNVNRAPTWDQYPHAVDVNEGDLVDFLVRGSDLDGEEVTLTFEPLEMPENVEFIDHGEGIGQFIWQTNYVDEGRYWVRFTISDGELEETIAIRINVRNVNQSPSFSFVPGQIEGDEDEIIAFNIAGVDPDVGDELTLSYSSDNLPQAASFTDHGDGSGTFVWRPDFDEAGEYSASFMLTDGEFELTADVPITVNDVNRSPYWVDNVTLIRVDEDGDLEVTVRGADLDGDDLTIEYNSDDIPGRDSEFTDHYNGTGTLTWHPGFEDAGEYTAEFILSDAGGAIPVRRITIIVDDVNRAPAFEVFPDEVIEVNEDSWAVFSVEADDPDGDDLSLFYESDDIPIEAEFRDNGGGTGTFTWRPSYEDAGDYTGTITVSDGLLEASADFEISVSNVNLPPFWTNIPDDIMQDETRNIDFIIQGEDPDDDDDLTIIYSSDDIPEAARFLDFENGAGRFTWRPGYEDAGEYTAHFTLSDGEYEDETEVRITVTNLNRAPTWDETYGPFDINEGQLVEFTVAGSDEDAEDELTITFTSIDLQRVAQFTDNGDGSGVFSWHTTYQDAGQYDATFTLSDGMVDVETQVLITVNDVNRPCSWISVNNNEDEYSVEEGGLIRFTARGYDPDGDDLTIEFDPGLLPDEAEFTIQGPGVGLFVWQTTNEDFGVYNLTFTLSDGEYEDVRRLQLLVGDVNRFPEWDRIPKNLSYKEEDLVEFQVVGIDPDDDELTLTYSSEDLPDDVTFTTNYNGAGTFRWEPGFGDAGQYTATFTLSDRVNTIEGDVIINVADINRRPYWVDIPDLVEAGEDVRFGILAFNVEAADPDGDDVSLSFSSDNLPDDARFSDFRDGTGSFTWMIDYDDAGYYTATFTVSDGDLEASEDVTINITDVNRPPVWTDYPEEIEADENDLILFTVEGYDPDGDDLWIDYISDDLPEEAVFIDNFDGTGTFRWHTTYADAGDYTACFTLTDSELEVAIEVPITVLNVNRAPRWVDYPENMHVTAYGDETTEIRVTAVDDDGDDVLYSWRWVDDEIDDCNFEVVDGTGVLTINPTRFEFGDYSVRFSSSDERLSTRLVIDISVINQHFILADVTNRQHTVRIESVMNYLDMEVRDNPDEFDEIATITPAGIVAGVYQFGDDEAPWLMTAMGATPDAEGFTPGEEFSFRHWDYDAGRENGANATLIAGDETWQVDGFSVFELVIGPGLSTDVEELNFGLARVNDEVERQITFLSNGTAPVEDLELMIDVDAFSVDDNGPVTLEPGEEWTVTVTFAPEEFGEFSAHLQAAPGYVELDVPLYGAAVEMGHFVYDITPTYHMIEVLDADVEIGHEIGIFNPTGLCVGALIVRGDGPWDLYAWGDDPDTRNIDGFRPGEAFEFRLWNGEEEITALPRYHTGPETWRLGGFTAVSLIIGEQHFNWIATQTSHHLTIGSVDFFGENLANGDEIAVVNPRALVSGGMIIDGGNMEFEAYGDNPETEYFTEGFLTGEHIYFRVWIRDQDREYLARPDWTNGPEVWEEDGNSSLNLTVTRENVAPIFSPHADVSGMESEELTFTIESTDHDGDAISLALTGIDLPEGTDFDDQGNGNGVFTWTPGPLHAGEHIAAFTAYDGWSWRDFEVTILITNVNHEPVMEEIGDQQVTEGELLSIVIKAEDRNGDRLNYSVQMPDGMDGAYMIGSLFRWTPNYSQAGVYENVVFRVTDFGQPPMFTEESITITVLEGNRAPVWQSRAPIVVSEGSTVLFNVTATDLDGDDLALSAGNLPENADFTDNDDGTGTFTWQTDHLSAGVYYQYFDADDGNFTARLTVEITVEDVNRRPRFDDIENQIVNTGSLLDLRINAIDPDDGDQVDLVLSAANLPPRAVFRDLGEGIGRLVWMPGMADRGVYPNITFTVRDASEAFDVARITITARVLDMIGPVISDLYPENRQILRVNEVTVSATITDAMSGVELVEFIFDNEVGIDDFDFDAELGEFAWMSNDPLEEGDHSYTIQAEDVLGNVGRATVAFTVNSTAGEIGLDELDRYTIFEEIDLTGFAEPYLHIELWRSGELLNEIIAERRGHFRFANVALNPRENMFILRGFDNVDNIALNDTVEIYLDLESPVINVNLPEQFVNDPTPQIQVQITDIGVGIDEDAGAYLALDGENIGNFVYRNGLLTYNIPEDLEEGEHIFNLAAVDLLGNSPEEPYDIPFFVDTQVPVVIHPYFEGEVDNIGNREPQINIAIDDPAPSSGILGEEIVLTVDDIERDFTWNEVYRAVYFDFGEGEFDLLEPGLHEIEITVTDRAGNQTTATGEFNIGNYDDENGPDYENMSPPDGSVAGIGGGGFNLLPYRQDADTISFVAMDIDVGVDWETIWMMIIALNNPDNPDDDDTTIVENDDLIFQIPPGRVMAPMWYTLPGQELAPNEMPGLEEGINQINVFGADEEGNEGEEQWEFFFDASQPEPPELDDPDTYYVNSPEISVSGSTGADLPEYPGGYDNIGTVRIYRNGELTVEEVVAYESDFTIEGILLVEGRNVIEATSVDGGGNESVYSDPIEVFLDMSLPGIVSFEAEGGPHLADDTPLFTARLVDNGSGIDENNITLLVNGEEVEGELADGVFTAEVQNAMDEGDYTAELTVLDMAGNESSEDYEFDIDLQAVAMPEFTLTGYTSVNRVYLTGEGEIGTEIVVYHLENEDDELNEEAEIGRIALVNETEFEFVRTIADLPDVSYVRLVAINEAEIESSPTDPQMLTVDQDAPEFTGMLPEDSEEVAAEDLEEIWIDVEDELAGVDENGFTVMLDGDDVDDFNFANGRLSIDVSDFEFEDNATVSMTIVACDMTLIPNIAQISWQFVTFINDPPVVNVPDHNFDEDTYLTIDLKDYISDPDNDFDELQVNVYFYEAQGRDNAELTLDREEGILHLTAHENWFGRFPISIDAVDPYDLPDEDNPSITVNPVNDPPVMGDLDVEVAMEGVLFELLVEATDVDEDELTFTDDTDLFDIAADGLIWFMPTREMRGINTITITVTDEADATDEESLMLVVSPGINPPTLQAGIQDQVFLEDDDARLITNLYNNFEDPDGDELIFTVTPNQDWLIVDLTDDADLYLQPEPNENGIVEVAVSATDGVGVAVDTFIVDVTAVNDPPRQVRPLPLEIIMDEDETFVTADLDTIFEDIDEGDLSYYTEGGENLGVDIDEENVLTVNPVENWFGDEAFTLFVDDGIEGGLGGPVRHNSDLNVSWSFTSIAPRRDEEMSLEITVEVLGVNDAPQVPNPIGEVQVEEDAGPWTIADLDTIFFEPDGEMMFYSVVADDPLETFISNENVLNMNAPLDFFGSGLNVTLTAEDESGTQMTDDFTVEVLGLPDPPEVVQPIDDREYDEDSGPWIIINLDDVFYDKDGDVLTYSVEVGDPVIEWSIDDESLLTLSSPMNFNAEEVEITVIADDGEEGAASASFNSARTMRQIGRDVGPVRQLRSIKANNNSSFSFNESFGSQSSAGVRRDDQVTETFNLAVLPVNDIPVMEEYPVEVVPNEGELVQFTITASDVDGDALTLTMEDDDGTVERGAQFVDNGDGTGTYMWQTDFEDAGNYYPVFNVNDGAGGMVEFTVRVLVGNVNREPGVVAAVSDMVFDEDTGPWIIADMDDVFSDPDNDNISYTIDAPDPLETTLDDNRVLTIGVPDDFNATGLSVIINAYDGTVTSADTFMVDINSINDMPTDYSLVDPYNHQVLAVPWVIFRWQESVDAVEDSAITYALVLCYDDSLHWYQDLEDTEMLMSRRTMMPDTSDTTRIEWWVWAYDGIDSLRSTKTFNLLIPPIVGREVEEEPLPTELKIGPVYPNPFNDIITIEFDLPWAGLAEVTVHDLRGRMIRKLVSDDMSVGRYRAYWDGFDDVGARAASGVYLCRLKVYDSIEMVRITLIR